MLSSNAITEALALASSAVGQNYALNPIPNSFLETLTGYTQNELDCAYKVGVSATERGWEVLSNLQWDHEVTSPHRVLFDDQAGAIAAVAQRNILTARTDAVPLIKEMFEHFNQVINPDIPYAYQRMEVVPVQFHPVWDNEYVATISNTFGTVLSKRQIPEGLILSYEDEAYKDYTELTKTGLPGVDKLLADALKGYTTERLDRLFQDVFRHGILPTFMVERFDDCPTDVILVHVWANKLEEISPSASKYSLAAYREGLANIVEATGVDISRYLDRRRQFADRQRVVLAYQGDSRVLVNADTYAAFTKEGGVPEIVMGAAIQNTSNGRTRPYDKADLLEQGPGLVKDWNSYVATTTRRTQEHLVSSARMELFKVIKEKIIERQATGLIDNVDCSIERLNLCLDDLPSNFVKNAYEHIRDIVVCVFYESTDVGNFVSALDDQFASDPEASNEDAEALATIDYLASWMAKFVRKCKFETGVTRMDEHGLVEHNGVVMANAIDLVVKACYSVLTKSVGARLGGSSLKEQALASLVAAKLRNKLAL